MIVLIPSELKWSVSSKIDKMKFLRLCNVRLKFERFNVAPAVITGPCPTYIMLIGRQHRRICATLVAHARETSLNLLVSPVRDVAWKDKAITHHSHASTVEAREATVIHSATHISIRQRIDSATAMPDQDGPTSITILHITGTGEEEASK
jgi:hypothetical protein